MAVVYLHKRNDTNEVFYVGIGKTLKRAFGKYSRTKYWKYIVEKVGYTVDILVSDTPWEDACKIEKLLIEKYGRKDLGLGKLINMTDGGDGSIGRVKSEDERLKLSIANKGQNNPNFGKTSSEEKKQNIGNTQRNREGIKGYTYIEKTNKFQAQIRFGGKRIYLGIYNTPEEAEEAYKNAKIKYFS